MFARSVGVKESSAYVDDRDAVPAHFQAGLLRNDSYGDGLQILSVGKGEESLCVLLFHYDRHALLRFADRKFSAVQTFIFARYLIEVYVESVCKLAYRDRNSAGSEIVASLDETGGFRVAEQALELALLRSISFLHLSAARLYGMGVVSLG